MHSHHLQVGTDCLSAASCASMPVPLSLAIAARRGFCNKNNALDLARSLHCAPWTNMQACAKESAAMASDIARSISKMLFANLILDLMPPDANKPMSGKSIT